MSGFYPGRPPVEAYGNGGFRFAQMSHRGSILLLPSGVHGWDGADVAAVLAEREAIDLFILGTGKTMAPPSRALRQAFASAGIQLDYMATGHAISTYNLLLAEKRQVAAGLIAVADAS